MAGHLASTLLRWLFRLRQHAKNLVKSVRRYSRLDRHRRDGGIFAHGSFVVSRLQATSTSKRILARPSHETTLGGPEIDVRKRDVVTGDIGITLQTMDRTTVDGIVTVPMLSTVSYLCRVPDFCAFVP